jgi:Cu+-exporting ATPase
MEKLKKVDLKCFHCGEPVLEVINFNDKQFCCEGCKTVYEILDQNNLCSYYDFNNNPGINRKADTNSKKFGYLDDEQVFSKLVSFSDESTTVVTFYIPTVHCSSCIYLLENLYKLKKGINRSTVNFLKKEATFVFDKSVVSLKELVETLAQIGYEPQINLNDLDKEKTGNPLRRYYIRIGVAFFCFGNIMLASFPEYLGLDLLAESRFRIFFGYINFILALPVMFFSASEFFVSAWTAARQRTLNMDIPIVLGIIAMFIRSSYEIFFQVGPGYFDTLASLVLLMLIGRLFQNKTYDTLSFERDYKSYFPVAVSVIRDGIELSIPLTKLKVGDRLVLRNGEIIPADALLLKGVASIDYSFVTGESTPVTKNVNDTLYAGGRHTGSAIEILINKEVSHSHLTRLWNDAAFKKEETENVTSLATKVSKWFTPLVIAIAFIAAIFWAGTDMNKAMNAFTSVLIITCPCALALSSPFTLGNVLRRLSNSSVYLKNALVIEKLAGITAIVFDKTGTLTNTKNATVEYKGEVLTEYELSLIKSLVYHSSHPLSKKVYTSLTGYSLIPTNHVKEFEGKGIEGWIDENCVRVGSKKYLYENDTDLAAKPESFSHASKVFVGINAKPKGYFVIKNEYRQGFTGLIDRLKAQFNLYVLSGDNDAEKKFLEQYIPADNLVFHQQPADKLDFVKQLKDKGEKVMMIGDGLNDAGALKQSNVGIAISDEANNFTPACDGIIEASEFTKINNILQYAKSGVNVIKMSFGISLLYNAVGVYLAVQGTMNPLVAAIIMPLSSVTIILFTTIASGVAGKKHGF